MLTMNPFLFSVLFFSSSAVLRTHSFRGGRTPTFSTTTRITDTRRQLGWQQMILYKVKSSSCRGTTSSTVCRKATVYAPSWEDEGGIFDDYDGGATTIDQRHAALAENISQRVGVAALARLAAVFNPNGHLDMRNIEHVEVLDVDNAHMDIEAVVCEDEGCVTLAVPVNFPRPCLVEEDEEGRQWNECVMGNLDELDVQATQAIRQLEWDEDHHEEVEAAKRELLTLQNSNIQDLHLPDWWVRPTTDLDESKLVRECANLRNILNEDDSRDDVQALATKSLSSYEYYDDWMVDRAAVAAVCSTGIILRASAHRVQLFFGDDNDNDAGNENGDDNNAMMVEIPIPFQGERANSPDDLREKVMDAVNAAADFAE